jgi:transposase
MANVAGIDWASEEHALCVADEAGTRLRERLVAHDEAEIAALCRELIALEVERVAIERPDRILVDRLLEAGSHRLRAIRPQAVARRRCGAGCATRPA